MFKKVLVCLITLMVVLTMSACSSDQKSPEDTLKKFEKAYNNLDFDTLLECIDPASAKALEAMTQLGGDLIGFDLGAILDLGPAVSNSSGYGIDTADFEMIDPIYQDDKLYATVIDRNENVSDMYVTFVFIDGKWYLQMDLFG